MVKKTTPATLTFDKEMFKKNVMYNVKTFTVRHWRRQLPSRFFRQWLIQ